MNKTLALMLSLAVAAGASSTAVAAPGDTVATVTHLSGLTSVTRADGSVYLISVRSQLMDGDTLTTVGDAFVRMKFVDQSELVLRPDSVLKIAEFTYRENDPSADRARIELVSGGFRAVTGALAKRSREAVGYETPRGTIKPMGTHLGALFCSNDCGGVPTPTGKTPDNGLHVDVASGAVVVTPKLTVALPSSGQGTAGPNVQSPAGSGLGGTQTPGGSTGTGGNTGTQAPGGTTPNPTAGPVGGVSPTLPGGTQANPTPAQGVPNPGAGAPSPSVVLNAGQFGYLPPPQNGVQPPLVLVPPSQAVQVRMPQSISQNNPQGSATSKGTDPECVVQ